MRTQQPTGIVASINDPAKAGRIKCALAAVDGNVYPEWIEPVFTPGWVSMPEVGDEVELIMPDGEDLIEFAHEIKYRGKVYDEAHPVPSSFQTNYPKRRGYYTKGGHLLIFDDQDGSVTITNGTTGDTIVLASNGTITFSPTTKAILDSALTELSTGPLQPVLLGTTVFDAFTAMTGSVATAYTTWSQSSKGLADVDVFITSLAGAWSTLAGTLAVWRSAKVETG